MNPGKLYFMNLSVKYVSEVNAMIDNDGIPLFRKAIIRCGLAQNTYGCWEIKQLFQHLQDIYGVIPWNLQEVQLNKQNLYYSAHTEY